METVLRVTAVYTFVTVGLRFLGKRELSELSPHELIMLMLVPELATQSMSRDDYSLTNTVIGIATLLSLVFLSSLLSYRFRAVNKAMEGEPVLLFAEGKFCREAMDRERVTADEILSEARARGLAGFEEVRWAILEPDGQINCIPRRPALLVAMENEPPKI